MTNTAKKEVKEVSTLARAAAANSKPSNTKPPVSKPLTAQPGKAAPGVAGPSIAAPSIAANTTTSPVPPVPEVPPTPLTREAELMKETLARLQTIETSRVDKTLNDLVTDLSFDPDMLELLNELRSRARKNSFEIESRAKVNAAASEHYLIHQHILNVPKQLYAKATILSQIEDTADVLAFLIRVLVRSGVAEEQLAFVVELVRLRMADKSLTRYDGFFLKREPKMDTLRSLATATNSKAAESDDKDMKSIGKSLTKLAADMDSFQKK